MWGILLKVGLALAPKFLPTVLGWFGIKLNETDLQVGERLGVAETNAAGNKKELDDAQKAVDAGRASDAVDASPGGVRQPHPGDKPWSPDQLG